MRFNQLNVNFPTVFFLLSGVWYIASVCDVDLSGLLCLVDELNFIILNKCANIKLKTIVVIVVVVDVAVLVNNFGREKKHT